MNFHSIPDLQLCLPLIVIVEDISYCPICLRIWIFLNLDFSFSLIFKIFLMWTIFKVFIEFVTILLLFYVSFFWPRSMWDLSSPTRDRTHTPWVGRRSLFFFLAVLGLRCSMWDLHWGVRDLSLLLTGFSRCGMWVFLFSSCGAQAPGRMGSIVVARGFQSA